MKYSLNESTYLKLKDDIMYLRLKPGDAVSAAKIADMYEVSRTPAREAIVKLEREGLLQIFPKSKTIVSKIDPNRAMQEWFVRSTLEIEMVPLFIENCTDAVIDRMKRNLEAQSASAKQEDAELHFRLDNEFHGIIYETAGELLAKEIIETNVTHYNRIRFLSDLSETVHQKTLREHAKIITLAEQKDVDALQDTLRSHIRRIHSDRNEVLKNYAEYFVTNPAPME